MIVWHKNAYNVCPSSIHYVHLTLAPQCLFDAEHLFDFIVKFCFYFYVKLCLYVMFFWSIVFAWSCFQNHVFVWRYISYWSFVSLRKSYSSLCIFYEWQQLCCVPHHYYLYYFIFLCFVSCVVVFFNYERLSHVDGYWRQFHNCYKILFYWSCYCK